MRVLVTGGASGIGAAIAARFRVDGAQVAVLERDEEALRQNGDGYTVLHADVTEQDSVAEAFARLDQLWQAAPDAVFNNAGISIREPFLTATLPDWRCVLDVNLTGIFVVAQAAARRMTAAGHGTIVNTGSVSGMVGMPGYASYNAAKAGVIELTKTLALELAPTVTVNCICPGYILTPMQEAEYTEQMLADCAAQVPLGRLGRPAEIAALASYLADPQARFVTGQSFVIDGGESAGGLASR